MSPVRRGEEVKHIERITYPDLSPDCEPILQSQIGEKR